MKKMKQIWMVLLIPFTLLGCRNSVTGPILIDEEQAERAFVWNAMNFWYYWQGDVPELADNFFSNNQAFADYLGGFSDAEALFESLLHSQDDFSFFIDDYETFQQGQQGISQSFGYEFGLVREKEGSNDLFGYVQYVLDGSPADIAGLERGNLFTEVDGIQLTESNYRELLLNRTSYRLTLAIVDNESLLKTGEEVDLQAVTLQEDPVFLSRIFNEGSATIGYLVYNAFRPNSHETLNNLFGDFLMGGVDELVIDLRYNGGGSGITSQMLAGMISGLDDNNEFATYSYNTKRAPALNQTVMILDEVPIGTDGTTVAMNRLSLNRVYFLTGLGTASASELLINALNPYMDVILIGRQTVGKDEGSFTLYDAPVPYVSKENANPDHKSAIQPIVLKLVNRDGETYPNGFAPDYEVREVTWQNLQEMPPLGSENDPLLAKALELITGQVVAKSPQKVSAGPGSPEFFRDSRDLQPYAKRLYLEPPSTGD